MNFILNVPHADTTFESSPYQANLIYSSSFLSLWPDLNTLSEMVYPNLAKRSGDSAGKKGYYICRLTCFDS